MNAISRIFRMTTNYVSIGHPPIIFLGKGSGSKRLIFIIPSGLAIERPYKSELILLPQNKQA